VSALLRRAAVAVLLAAGLARPAAADQIYLPEQDVPRAIYPDSTGVEHRSLDLTPAELERLSKTLGRKVEARSYPYLEVRKGDAVLGAIFILDAMGQTKPITFAVAVAPSGELHEIQVMIYREPHGEEIREARFRKQFAGKRLQDPVALGKDIDAITGATISSRSAAYAARKGLALAEILRRRAPSPASSPGPASSTNPAGAASPTRTASPDAGAPPQPAPAPAPAP
jgi:Na+-translocating ferredoxin:NAD+ oxidoreductase RnfG subunit